MLRFIGFVIAIGLTVVAAWMIALGHSQREVSLGVITGLWGALVGAMAFYSGRHSGQPVANGASAGAEVELRQDFALELEREVSARRAYEQQLHEMVRREIETIQRVVGDQLGKLRDDVATLRGDLVDQVGGKIRLERIETTRVIGSDIEALQNDIRQLAGARLHEPVNRPAEAPQRVFEVPRSSAPEPVRAMDLGPQVGGPGSIRSADRAMAGNDHSDRRHSSSRAQFDQRPAPQLPPPALPAEPMAPAAAGPPRPISPTWRRSTHRLSRTPRRRPTARPSPSRCTPRRPRRPRCSRRTRASRCARRRHRVARAIGAAGVVGAAVCGARPAATRADAATDEFCPGPVGAAAAAAVRAPGAAGRTDLHAGRAAALPPR